VLHRTNKYFTDNEPWKLQKTDKDRWGTVLFVSIEAARLCALLLQPIMPRSAGRMLDMLGVPVTERDFRFVGFGRSATGVHLTKAILFSKVAEESRGREGSQ
jgi:methionyl-tRNA synthetase